MYAKNVDMTCTSFKSEVGNAKIEPNMTTQTNIFQLSPNVGVNEVNFLSIIISQ